MPRRKRKPTEWAPTIDDYCFYWEAPARHVLVESSSVESPFIANADSLSTAMIDIPDPLLPELLDRMRAAGVVRLSAAQYRLALREDRGGRRLPQQIRATELGVMGLVRLNDGRFQIVTPGLPASMHCGFEHILAERSLAELFCRHASEDISQLPATIYDPASGLQHETHCELVVRKQITPDLLATHAWPAAREWHYGRKALFVCAEVRDALVDANADIVFVPGFFGWA